MSRSAYVSMHPRYDALPAAGSHCGSGSWTRERAVYQLEVPIRLLRSPRSEDKQKIHEMAQLEHMLIGVLSPT